jgi:hypothetical protein
VGLFSIKARATPPEAGVIGENRDDIAVALRKHLEAFPDFC